MKKFMEININSDLGEKSKHHSAKYDKDLLEIVNSANIACGFHAGDNETMKDTIVSSKKNKVSIGAHPSFKDLENFGRKRINLNKKEIQNLITEQYNILNEIAEQFNEKVTHIKPHGALNNMACEDLELADTISDIIFKINRDIIYLLPTGSKMQEAAKKYDLKVACEIFADRNYDDEGNLISRNKPNALIIEPEIAKNHALSMVKNQAINCLSGKKIDCEIDSICIHGDNINSLETAKEIKKMLIENNIKLMPLTKLKKFL